MLTVLKRLACFIIDKNISRDKKDNKKTFSFIDVLLFAKTEHKTMIHIKRVMLLSMVVAISRVAFFGTKLILQLITLQLKHSENTSFHVSFFFNTPKVQKKIIWNGYIFKY